MPIYHLEGGILVYLDYVAVNDGGGGGGGGHAHADGTSTNVGGGGGVEDDAVIGIASTLMSTTGTPQRRRMT
jgi:hypothetical protein